MKEFLLKDQLDLMFIALGSSSDESEYGEEIHQKIFNDDNYDVSQTTTKLTPLKSMVSTG